MSAPVLVGYATRYGSTQEVAETIAAALRARGFQVDVQLLGQVRSVTEYSAIVMGAPLFMFHWHKDALHFLSQHRDALAQRPVAVFVLGPVKDPPDEQEWQNSRAQLDKELAKFPWFHPVALQMFGGKYDPASLGFPLKHLTGKAPPSDIRDWTAIGSWAAELPDVLQLTSPSTMPSDA